MAVVAFLRGVNIGGHRTFRPSVFARELGDLEMVNIGAAGTFVICKPGPMAALRTELKRKLPFETEVFLCEARELVRLIRSRPFGGKSPEMGAVRFVSILPRACRVAPRMPIRYPDEGEWLVRLVTVQGRFLLGEYRRDMKTIRYLGEIDKLFGSKLTTRNWKTMMQIAEIVEERVGRK